MIQTHTHCRSCGSCHRQPHCCLPPGLQAALDISPTELQQAHSLAACLGAAAAEAQLARGSLALAVCGGHIESLMLGVLVSRLEAGREREEEQNDLALQL